MEGAQDVGSDHPGLRAHRLYNSLQRRRPPITTTQFTHQRVRGRKETCLAKSTRAERREALAGKLMIEQGMPRLPSTASTTPTAKAGAKRAQLHHNARARPRTTICEGKQWLNEGIAWQWRSSPIMWQATDLVGRGMSPFICPLVGWQAAVSGKARVISSTDPRHVKPLQGPS